MLCKNWYLLGKRKIQASPQNRISVLYLLGVLFKIIDKHPCPFYMEGGQKTSVSDMEGDNRTVVSSGGSSYSGQC